MSDADDDGEVGSADLVGLEGFWDREPDAVPKAVTDLRGRTDGVVVVRWGQVPVALYRDWTARTVDEGRLRRLFPDPDDLDVIGAVAFHDVLRDAFAVAEAGITDGRRRTSGYFAAIEANEIHGVENDTGDTRTFRARALTLHDLLGRAFPTDNVMVRWYLHDLPGWEPRVGPHQCRAAVEAHAANQVTVELALEELRLKVRYPEWGGVVASTPEAILRAALDGDGRIPLLDPTDMRTVLEAAGDVRLGVVVDVGRAAALDALAFAEERPDTTVVLSAEG